MISLVILIGGLAKGVENQRSGKGNWVSSNYREITLLSVPWTVCAQVLRRRALETELCLDGQPV